ncbi:MAG: FAD-dependent oxidoreductase, partial [Coriobacteriales bacterium]|nr:FAD-dependent oxidoreductase [Coriobacteriales bacterium]
MAKPILIIGAGLAGSEAAWQLAERGVKVRLLEMRPLLQTAVHRTADFAELVCSNSLKSLDADSAAGSLKNELAVMGSGLLSWAIEHQVAAGKALAVDREAFARSVTEALTNHPNIEVIHQEFTDLASLIESDTPSIIASGPLTSKALETELNQALGSEHLAFFDAAAPIV